MEDLTGKVFGSLTVLGFDFAARSQGYTYRWICRCSCGVVKSVQAGHLKSGATVSCGCRVSSRAGATLHPLFRTWSNMMARCYDPTRDDFPNYGGRGISVVSRWHDFWAFAEDMGERPSGATLERADNDVGYGPGNCRWADRVEQANNKRNVPTLELEGRRLSVAQWARHAGIPTETLRSRLNRGVPLHEAMRGRRDQPPHHNHARNHDQRTN